MCVILWFSHAFVRSRLHLTNDQRQGRLNQKLHQPERGVLLSFALCWSAHSLGSPSSPSVRRFVAASVQLQMVGAREWPFAVLTLEWLQTGVLPVMSGQFVGAGEGQSALRETAAKRSIACSVEREFKKTLFRFCARGEHSMSACKNLRRLRLQPDCGDCRRCNLYSRR